MRLTRINLMVIIGCLIHLKGIFQDEVKSFELKNGVIGFPGKREYEYSPIRTPRAVNMDFLSSVRPWTSTFTQKLTSFGKRISTISDSESDKNLISNTDLTYATREVTPRTVLSKADFHKNDKIEIYLESTEQESTEQETTSLETELGKTTAVQSLAIKTSMNKHQTSTEYPVTVTELEKTANAKPTTNKIPQNSHQPRTENPVTVTELEKTTNGKPITNKIPQNSHQPRTENSVITVTELEKTTELEKSELLTTKLGKSELLTTELEKSELLTTELEKRELLTTELEKSELEKTTVASSLATKTSPDNHQTSTGNLITQKNTSRNRSEFHIEIPPRTDGRIQRRISNQPTTNLSTLQLKYPIVSTNYLFMGPPKSLDGGQEPFSPQEIANKTSTGKITNPIHHDLLGPIFSAILSDSTPIPTNSDEKTLEKMVTREINTDAGTFSKLSPGVEYDSLSTVSDEMLASDDDSRNSTNIEDNGPTIEPTPRPNIRMYGHILPEESYIILTAGCVAPVILVTLILLVLGCKRKREERHRQIQIQHEVNDSLERRYS